MCVCSVLCAVWVVLRVFVVLVSYCSASNSSTQQHTTAPAHDLEPGVNSDGSQKRSNEEGVQCLCGECALWGVLCVFDCCVGVLLCATVPLCAVLLCLAVSLCAHSALSAAHIGNTQVLHMSPVSCR